MNIDLGTLKKYNVPAPRYTSYPTAPQFTEKCTYKDYEEAIEKTNEIQRPLSLYFHLPYCATLCWYCGCNLTISNDQKKINTYVNYLKKEISLIKEKLKGDHRVVQLQWGGGSPSHITRQEQQDLMQHINNNFEIVPFAEIGTEIDPRDIRDGDIAALRSFGFNRISFGVQDLNPEVQQAVNRVHSEELIQNLIQQMRSAGFGSINTDLMYGLPKQTLASFTETIEKMIKMDPDRIALFNFAYLPKMIKHQKIIKPEDLPPAEEKLEILKMSIETLTAAGYVYIGMDHFAKPDDELCRAQKEKTLYRNFQGYSTHADCDLLAFGNSSIGQLESLYVQNQKVVKDYCTALDNNIPPTARGIHLSLDDHIRRDIIKRIMCNLELNKHEVEVLWNISFDEYFQDSITELDPLAEDGLIELSEGGFKVTYMGRLLLRNIAVVFDRYIKEQQKSQQLFSKSV